MGVRVGGRVGPVSASTRVSGDGCGYFMAFILVAGVIAGIVWCVRWGVIEAGRHWVWFAVPGGLILVVLGLSGLGYLIARSRDRKAVRNPGTATTSGGSPEAEHGFDSGPPANLRPTPLKWRVSAGRQQQ
jgi:hypothetical protein